MPKVQTILVVCAGNVGRSPLLAAILNYHLKSHSFRVISRGMHIPSTYPDLGAYSEVVKSIQHLLRHQLADKKQFLEEILKQLQAHQSKVISLDDVRSANLILTMEPSLSQELFARFGKECGRLRRKLFTAPEFHVRSAQLKVPERSRNALSVIDMADFDPVNKTYKGWPVGRELMRIINQEFRLGESIAARVKHSRVHTWQKGAAMGQRRGNPAIQKITRPKKRNRGRGK